MKNCKSCQAEIQDKAVICPSCGCKVKKPIYKRVWFWILMIVFVIPMFFSVLAGLAGNSGGSSESVVVEQKETNATESATEAVAVVEEESVEVVAVVEEESVEVVEEVVEIAYLDVDADTMLGDLESNALKAETLYQDTYVRLTGELSNIDSDGKYITLTCSSWDISWNSIQCYIKDEEQLGKVMEMAKGDTVTLEGQVTDIGEILGYQLDIVQIIS